MQPTLFDIDHSLTCRAEGYKVSERFSRSQKDRVLGCLTFGGPMTALEIAEDTGIRLSSVCGRLNELLYDVRVKKSGTKVNVVSGIRNSTWEAL